MQSDPIGINGGSNTYSYVGSRASSTIDSLGLDWFEYTGRHLKVWEGNYPDRSNMLRDCPATSGIAWLTADGWNRSYQRREHQNRANIGPVSEGRYFIDLRPDPSRIARTLPNGETVPGAGVEHLPNSAIFDYSAWGTWRARLQRNSRQGNRDNFYLHNSHKGYTHGCVETTCDDLLQYLIQYRVLGNSRIDFVINYQDATTYGGTLK